MHFVLLTSFSFIKWSDSSSLDLLQQLLQDEDIPSLLLVGAYRDDEVQETHPLALHVKDMERLGSTVTKIELGNLDEGAVRNLVAEALNMEDSMEKVEPLAGIVCELCRLVGRSALLLAVASVACSHRTLFQYLFYQTRRPKETLSL